MWDSKDTRCVKSCQIKVYLVFSHKSDLPDDQGIAQWWFFSVFCDVSLFDDGDVFSNIYVQKLIFIFGLRVLFGLSSFFSRMVAIPKRLPKELGKTGVGSFESEIKKQK